METSGRGGRRSIPSELLEPRTLLSSLGDFVGLSPDDPRRWTALPRSSDVVAGPEANAAISVDADLVRLANRVEPAMLPVLDRADAMLLRMYSRWLGGMSARQAVAIDGAGEFQFSADRPLVSFGVTDVNAAGQALRGLGAEVTTKVSRGVWQIVEAFLSVSRIARAAALPQVRTMNLVGNAVTRTQGAAANAWESVSLAAQFKRIHPAITGVGVNVGVISDSFNSVAGGIAASQFTGDLPGDAQIVRLSDGAGSDEGRAMAELIHDVAPGAKLILHTSQGMFKNSPSTLASAIGNVASAGAHVIAEDVFFLEEPVFQDGIVNMAVDDAYNTHGVLYFSAAGNGNGSSYLGTWNDPDNDGLHNFSGDDELLNLVVPTTRNNFRIALQFDDSWGSADNDIDIEIYRIINGQVDDKIFDSDTNNTGGNPLDILAGTLTGGAYAIALRSVSGNPTGQRLFLYSNEQNNDIYTEYTAGMPGVYGHANAEFGFAIGAVPVSNPSVIESFSALGGVPIVFDDNGTPLAQAVIRQNPAFVAGDGVTTTVPGFNSVHPFFGTSAAAPNAAAVAALILDAAGNPGTFTWEQMRDRLRDTAIDLGAAGYDTTFGHGRISGLYGPLPSAGRPIPQTVLELNQFGVGTSQGTLSNNPDRGGFVFGTSGDGQTVVDVARTGAIIFDPAVLIWNASNDAFVTHASGGGANPQATATASAPFLYHADVISQTNLLTLPDVTYSITVNAPDAAMIDLPLDLRGDAVRNDSLGAIETDYFRVTAPSNALGAGTFRVTPVGGFDAVLTLFDAAGNQLARSNTAGAGGEELVNIPNGLVPGAAYVIRVGSLNYAGSGAYQLSVNYTALPSGLPLTWTDPGEGVLVPDRSGVFGTGITPSSAIASPGQRHSYYFGLNSKNSGPMIFTLSAIADAPSTVQPGFVVYEAATGQRVAHASQSEGGATVINVPATLGTRYIVAVADETGTRTGGLRLGGSVGGQTAGTTLIALTPEGDGSISLPSPPPAIPAGGEVLFYRFVPPGGATGTGTITFDAAAADGEIWVFDTTESMVGFARSAGPGSPEVLNLSGLSAGSTYTIVVLPQNYGENIGIGTIAIDLDAITGTATGIKFRDDNRNGVQDGGEPGLAGFRIYWDENDNGQFDPLERSALTGADGTYSLGGLVIPTGPEFARIREVQQPGYTQTAPASGSYQLFISVANPVVPNINFGNYRQLDFGDAPDTYKTTLASDGPRHWLMPGFTLGTQWDGELNGAPTEAANGDDTTGVDDEDGVVVTVPLVPATTGRFTVTAPMGGVLDAWFDFDRNGAFDPADRIASSLTLTAGANAVDVAIPAGMPAGDVYARFRLTRGGIADPLGFGDVGEVEDYRFGVGVTPPPPSQPDLAPASDLGPFNNDNITSDNSPTFTGTAAPSVLVRLFRDGVEVASGMSSGGGTWTLTDPGPAPEGVRSYTATADAGSGQSAPSPPLAVTIDITPPNILMSSLLIDLPVQTFGILFSENVGPSIQPNDFNFFNVTDTAPIPPGQLMPMYDPMFNALRISFPGAGSPSGAGILPNGNYTLTILAGRITDLAGVGNALFQTSFFVLAGDANRDRSANIGDFSILASNFNQSSRTFSLGDFNYSGTVDIADFSILASQFNKTLPAPSDLPRAGAPAGIGLPPAAALPAFTGERIEDRPVALLL